MEIKRAALSASSDDVIRVRRATSGDYDNVIAINDDVEEGLDYLPNVYHEYVDSPEHYAVYVAVHRDKVVALLMFGLEGYPEGESSMTAWRTKPEYQGRGIVHLLRRQFLKEFPSIRYYLGLGSLTPASERPLQTRELLYKMNIAYYHINASVLPILVERRRKQKQTGLSDDLQNLHVLSTESCQTLIASGQYERLLSKYAVHFVVQGGPSWDPVIISNKRLLMEKLSHDRTVVSYGQNKQHSKDEKCDISSLSHSFHFTLKTRSKRGHVAVKILFYGDDISSLVDHFMDHVGHLAEQVCCSTIAHSDETGRPNLNVMFQFPLTVDTQQVDMAIRSLIYGAGEQSSADDNRQTFSSLPGTLYFARKVAHSQSSL